jgi:hypothetical protein
MADFWGAADSIVTGGKEKQAVKDKTRAVDELRGLEVPELEQLQAQYEDAVYRGDMEAAEIARSAMEDVSTDPRLREAQMRALSQLQEVGDGGLTLQDKADLTRIADDEAMRERGSREAILQNAQARGVAGSGLELASQLMNSQESTTRAANRDMDVAARAQERALQAILKSGDLGGSIRGQEFGEEASKAEARDALAKFNAQNVQAANLRNANTRQDVSNLNTGIRNEQRTQNVNAAAEKFGMDAKRAGGISGAYGDRANLEDEQAARRVKGTQSAISQTMTGVGASDERLKEDIEEFDAEDFLDSITGYKYKYKNPRKHGEGKQVGVMAQDLEKGAPQMVQEGPDGKYVDYSKAAGPIFASLASLNKRLKDIEGK